MHCPVRPDSGLCIHDPTLGRAAARGPHRPWHLRRACPTGAGRENAWPVDKGVAHGAEGHTDGEDLLTAFAGDSQARKRYTYFASAVFKEGFRQVSDIFEETANQEREHAKRLFKFLEGGEVEITAAFPAGTIATAAQNLKGSAAGENHEWTNMYPSFAKVARRGPR